MKIGVICDDFTGTASAGVLIAKTGARTGLFMDTQALRGFENRDQLDAAYVSSNSRHLKPEAAMAAVQTATEDLKAAGACCFGKKIDTTLRGGIGYEIDAALQVLGDDYVAVMVTAMPQSKRICVGGYAVIDSTILTETFVKDDVITPVHECYVPDLVRAQSRHSVRLIDMHTVLRGPAETAKQLKAARDAGARILIADAISLAHVDTVAQACVSLNWSVLSVDPGPFTMCMAKRRGLLPETPMPNDTPAEPARDKPALFVVGSANPETKKQMDVLRDVNDRVRTVSVSPQALIEGDAVAEREIRRAAEAAIELIGAAAKPEAVLVETALHDAPIDLAAADTAHGYPRGKSSQMINWGLGQIAKTILNAVGRDGIAGLLLTGGDTMEQVARAIGVQCIEAQDHITAQIDVGRIIGKYSGLPLVVKGGFCGYDTVGMDILDRLFLESARSEQ